MELLDDRPSGGARVLALGDDRSAGAVNDLLHEDVPALAGRSFGLADTLVAERAKDIRHQILALESREIGKNGQVFVGVYLTGGNTVSIGLMKHIE